MAAPDDTVTTAILPAGIAADLLPDDQAQLGPELPPRALAAALKRWRRLQSMKQGHLAELMGVTQGTVSRWESGTHAPSPAERRALVRLLEAPLDSAGDWVLRRLIAESGQALHLVCDVTHRLLAASPRREQEWRRPASDFMGQSLWRYATDEIREAEFHLVDMGWHAGIPRPLATWTPENDEQDLHINPGMMMWERIQLSDGSHVRLVTAAPLADLARARPDALFLRTGPQGG
ncbi:MAG TPA: helix-turn-helix transcriptional regulator [Azospirillaceae bacterium]|nr:helix-turn-helix transcriptional regulator [Azospirillaceae bacterium]